MRLFFQVLGLLLFAAPWLAGIVIAKGFWSTLFALLFFPYGWYLVVEKIMQLNGWLG